MENNISNLIHEREMINSRMERMIYGSIEIREKSNNRYIYVHRRIDGIKESKYVGEYSNELYTMIVSNNELAKQYKNRYVIIDASKPLDEVVENTWKEILKKLGK